MHEINIFLLIVFVDQVDNNFYYNIFFISSTLCNH